MAHDTDRRSLRSLRSIGMTARRGSCVLYICFVTWASWKNISKLCSAVPFCFALSKISRSRSDFHPFLQSSQP
jgi:hypothetical protein